MVSNPLSVLSQVGVDWLVDNVLLLETCGAAGLAHTQQGVIPANLPREDPGALRDGDGAVADGRVATARSGAGVYWGAVPLTTPAGTSRTAFARVRVRAVARRA